MLLFSPDLMREDRRNPTAGGQGDVLHNSFIHDAAPGCGRAWLARRVRLAREVGGSTARATLSDGDVVLGAAPTNVCTPGTNVNCTSSLTGIVNTASAGDAFHGFSASGIGVGGFSTSGRGVKGESGSGNGVVGSSSSAKGVVGEGVSGVVGSTVSATGIGVRAENGGHAGATALDAIGKTTLGGPNTLGGQSTFTGKTTFARSGKLTVSAGTSSATKGPINLGSKSLVFATIQGNQAGVYVQGVTQVAGSSGSFTIHLSKNTTANLPVAWFVVN